VTRMRPAGWLVAAVGLFVLAVAGYALLVRAFPLYYWKQIDTAVYRNGGLAVRNQPVMLYALEFGAAKLPFTQGVYDPTAPLRPRGWLLLAPNRGNNGTAEFTWRGLELIAGNYYVLTLLVFIAATAGALILTHRLGGKVRELRFHLLAQQTRVTYWLAPGRRVILLTVFRKTRSAETAEVSRAQQAQKICETEHRPAHVTFDREVP
jgi:Phage derived protein Gp49-like (DUF891)